jgi:hypothetical protein
VITQMVRLFVAGVCLLGLFPPVVFAQRVPPPRIDVPEVPAELRVPAGHEVFLQGFASGTQNYVCLPGSAGPAWKFIGPQATLYQTFKGEPRQQITTHFLSADASENHVARPTWQHSFDSSRVWGRLVASSTDGNYVAPGAIAWLLLAAAVTEAGNEGGVALADTTFIQRVNTSGGSAPSTASSYPSQVGSVALVPYTTDYYFYRAQRNR